MGRTSKILASWLFLGSRQLRLLPTPAAPCHQLSAFWANTHAMATCLVRKAVHSWFLGTWFLGTWWLGRWWLGRWWLGRWWIALRRWARCAHTALNQQVTCDLNSKTHVSREFWLTLPNCGLWCGVDAKIQFLRVNSAEYRQDWLSQRLKSGFAGRSTASRLPFARVLWQLLKDCGTLFPEMCFIHMNKLQCICGFGPFPVHDVAH